MSLLLENIRKTYRQPEGGRLPVLGIERFQLQRGEQAALIGSSGGGKTTLLNIIAGILTPDSGQVVIDGRDIVGKFETIEWRRRALVETNVAQRQIAVTQPHGTRPPTQLDGLRLFGKRVA